MEPPMVSQPRRVLTVSPGGGSDLQPIELAKSFENQLEMCFTPPLVEPNFYALKTNKS